MYMGMTIDTIDTIGNRYARSGILIIISIYF